jgi:hypothetical protein
MCVFQNIIQYEKTETRDRENVTLLGGSRFVLNPYGILPKLMPANFFIPRCSRFWSIWLSFLSFLITDSR